MYSYLLVDISIGNKSLSCYLIVYYIPLCPCNEVICDIAAECSADQYKCRDGSCVDGGDSIRCDSTHDCLDGSDEDGCGKRVQLLLTIHDYCGCHLKLFVKASLDSALTRNCVHASISFPTCSTVMV